MGAVAMKPVLCLLLVTILAGPAAAADDAASPPQLTLDALPGLALGHDTGAAISAQRGVDELGIANALGPTPLVKCKTKDLEVPADCEIVLEGRLIAKQAPEGPFVDLTVTVDIKRQQPIFEIDCVTMRRDAIFQALLPGRLEHKTLM